MDVTFKIAAQSSKWWWLGELAVMANVWQIISINRAALINAQNLLYLSQLRYTNSNHICGQIPIFRNANTFGIRKINYRLLDTQQTVRSLHGSIVYGSIFHLEIVILGTVSLQWLVEREGYEQMSWARGHIASIQPATCRWIWNLSD